MKTKPFIIGIMFALIALTVMGATYTTSRMAIFTAQGDSVDVLVQDQHTVPVELFLYRELNAVVINTAAGARTNTLLLDPGHGFVVGDFLNIYHIDNNFLGAGLTRRKFVQLEVVSVVTNTIRTDMYIGFDLTPANVIYSNRVTAEQNVLGTIDAPVKFELCVPPELQWDITRLMPTMVLATQPDDALFGDIAALSNGVMYGFENNFFEVYLFSIKSNAGWKGTAYDVNYAARSGGGGSWGMSVRKSIAGEDKYGVAIQLTGSSNDCLVKYVQDDIRGINAFRDKVMGHNTAESILIE